MKRLVTSGLALLASFAAISLSSAPAQAAELEETISLPTTGSGKSYTMVPDGTFWTLSSCGTACHNIEHFSSAGSNLGGAVRVTRSFCSATLNGIAVVGARAYLQDACPIQRSGILSYVIDGSVSGDNPGEVSSDGNANYRFGGGIRVTGAGLAIPGPGSINLASPSALATAPFYPMTVMGVGVGTGSSNFEYCELGGPSSEACRQGGTVFPEPEMGSLSGVYDIAGTPTLLYAVENIGNEVTAIAAVNQGGVSGWDPQFDFGNDSQADLSSPVSAVIDPSTSHLFVADGGNNRISEFNAAGFRLRSFGYGVSPGGGNGFETCEPSVAPGCKAGIPYDQNPSSYFGRLDFGSDGRLYAHQPLLGFTIQAIDVTGGPDPVDKKVDLAAKPLEVKKGKKTTLTATLSPCADSGDDRALFQIKDGRGFDNIGGAKAVDDDCKAKTSKEIKKKSVFRSLSIGPGENTLATSPKVTVKVK